MEQNAILDFSCLCANKDRKHIHIPKEEFIMAERTAISSKLKLTVSYQDHEGAQKKRQMTFAHLKPSAEPESITAVATAIGTLQDDPITSIREVIENEITA